MKRILIWTGKGLVYMAVVCLPFIITIPGMIWWCNWMDTIPGAWDAWWNTVTACSIFLIPQIIWLMFINGILGSTWKSIWNA